MYVLANCICLVHSRTVISADLGGHVIVEMESWCPIVFHMDMILNAWGHICHYEYVLIGGKNLYLHAPSWPGLPLYQVRQATSTFNCNCRLAAALDFFKDKKPVFVLNVQNAYTSYCCSGLQNSTYIKTVSCPGAMPRTVCGRNSSIPTSKADYCRTLCYGWHQDLL